MNKSISSSPIVRVNAIDSSRSAGAGCPCRSGKGSGGSPPRHVLKKVLLVVLSLSVFFSLLAVIPSAYNVPVTNYSEYYDDPYGYNIAYFSNDTFGNAQYKYIPIDDYKQEYIYYTEGFINRQEYFDDDEFIAYHQLSDIQIDSLTFTTVPIYFYNINGRSIYDAIRGELFNQSIDFSDYVAESAMYRVVISGYSVDGEFSDFVYGSSYRYLDDDFGQIDFGALLMGYVYDHFITDFGSYYVSVPVSVKITLEFINLGISDGDVISVTNKCFSAYSGSEVVYLDELRIVSGQDYYDDGYNLGIQEGYDEGFTDGSADGYLDGYNAGQTSAITADGIGGLLSDAVSGFLDTNIFGTISIGDILLCVCGIALVLIFLKFFAGG